MTALKPGWKRVQLGDVATAFSKRVPDPATSKYERFVSSEHIDRFDLVIRRWGDASDITSSKKAFEPGDYLFVGRSLYASDFRERAARVNFAGVSSNGIIAIREDSSDLADGFLSVVLNSPEIWEFVVKNATGTLTRYVYWKTLREYEFALPPWEEQRQIATAMIAFEAAIGKMDDLVDSLMNVGDSVVAQSFVFDDSTIKNYVSVVTKGTTPSTIGHDYDSDGIPFIRCEDLRNLPSDFSNTAKRIDTSTHQSLGRSQIGNGDILLSIVGTVGNVALAKGMRTGANCNQNVAIIRPNDLEDSDFLFHWMQTWHVKRQFLSEMITGTVSSLNLSMIKCIRVPRMTTAERDRFVALSTELARTKEGIAARRAALAGLKTQFLNGCLRRQL